MATAIISLDPRYYTIATRHYIHALQLQQSKAETQIIEAQACAQIALDKICAIVAPVANSRVNIR